MSELVLQNAAVALHELQESTYYRALDDLRGSERFPAFRQRVETAQARCLAVLPSEVASPDEVRDLVKPLLSECTGKLAPLRPFVEKVLAELDR